MKKLLFLLVAIPYFAFAQNNDDSKYLAGAVPMDNDKIIFTKIINAPGLDESKLYGIDLLWLESRMAENANKSSIVYKDQESGVCIGAAEEYIVFRSSALVLDRATINYRLIITAENGSVKLQVQNIKYSYNNTQDGKPTKYIAEEWISDKYALNKAKTKMYPGMGKFRKKTIDLVDELAESLRKDIEKAVVSNVSNTQMAISQPASTPDAAMTTILDASANQVANVNTEYKTITASTSIPVTKTTVATQTAPVQSATPAQFEGYNKVAPDKIPGNIIKLISQDWMLITAGNKDKFNTMTANWGGIGYLYNKPVAICFINPARYTYEFMENSDTYTLTFYTEAYREALEYCGKVSGRDTDKVKNSGLTPVILPDGSVAFKQAWLIIECKKLVSQSLSPDSINDPAEKTKRASQPMHKMYIGEIINVYMK